MFEAYNQSADSHRSLRHLLAGRECQKWQVSSFHRDAEHLRACFSRLGDLQRPQSADSAIGALVLSNVSRMPLLPCKGPLASYRDCYRAAQSSRQKLCKAGEEGNKHARQGAMDGPSRAQEAMAAFSRTVPGSALAASSGATSASKPASLATAMGTAANEEMRRSSEDSERSQQQGFSPGGLRRDQRFSAPDCCFLDAHTPPGSLQGGQLIQRSLSTALQEPWPCEAHEEVCLAAAAALYAARASAHTLLVQEAECSTGQALPLAQQDSFLHMLAATDPQAALQLSRRLTAARQTVSFVTRKVSQLSGSELARVSSRLTCSDRLS